MMLKLDARWYAMLALGACALTTGCVKRECTAEEREAAGADENDDCTKYVPLQTFTSDDADERSVAWSSGTDLKIRGDIRTVSIVKGDSDEVNVAFKAQVDLAQDREKSVIEKTMSHLEPSLRENGGAVEVSASRGDTESNLGAAITVRIPADFDANIVIDKTTRLPGDVSVKYLGGTQQLVIDMNGLGADLSLADVGSVERVTVNTRGDIDTGAFSALQAGVIHSSHGDVTAAFANVPQSHVKVLADFGEVGLKLPFDGTFSLRAEADQGVSTGNAPESCVSNAVPSPKLMECGGGDPNGVTFEIKASQEASLTFD